MMQCLSNIYGKLSWIVDTVRIQSGVVQQIMSIERRSDLRADNIVIIALQSNNNEI